MSYLIKEYYIKSALKLSEYSKDPNTKVGALIVQNEEKIIGSGINEMPNSSDNYTWNRDGKLSETKYGYIIHAEANAIFDASAIDPENVDNPELENCDLFVTLFPCNECAKLISKTKIKNVYYYSDKYHDTESCKCSRKIFDECGIHYEQIKLRNLSYEQK